MPDKVVSKGVIKHVQLFEGRHPVPSYVKGSIFESDTNIHVLDIIKLEETATQQLLKWRAQGVTAIYVYLSGLTTAAIAVINAAYRTKLYVKFYHYSYMQDEWIPQTVAYFNEVMSDNVPSVDETKLIERERSLRANVSDEMYADIISYMRIFRDVEIASKKPGFNWDNELRRILHTYSTVNVRLVQLMGGCLNTKKGEKGSVKYLGKLRKELQAGEPGRRSYVRPLAKGATYHQKYYS